MPEKDDKLIAWTKRINSFFLFLAFVWNIIIQVATDLLKICLLLGIGALLCVAGYYLFGEELLDFWYWVHYQLITQ